MEWIMELENALLKNIKLTRQQQIAGISSIIFCLIANLYFMCNMLLNDDTVVTYYSMASPYDKEFFIRALANGRGQYAQYIASWFRTPFFSGVLIICCVAIISIIVVEIIRIKSRIGAGICGGIIAVFPAITAFMSVWAFEYMISAAFVVAAVYLGEKKEKVLLAILLSGVGLSILPINFMCILVLNIYIVIRKILSDENVSLDSLVKSIIRQSIIFAGGLVIVYMGVFYAIYASNVPVELSSYQGGDTAITGRWLKDIIPNIVEAFRKTRKFHTGTMSMIPQLKFTLKVCYIIQAAGVVFLGLEKRIFKNIGNTIILVFCILALPIAVSAVSIISPSFQYSWQHRIQWVFILSGALMIGEMLVESIWKYERIRSLAKIIYIIVVINMGLMVYGFAVTDNIIWSSAHYVVQRDTALCTRILAVLDSIEGFDYNTNKVCFMNFVDVADYDTTTSLLGKEPELYRTVTADLESNLWCYGDTSIRAHIAIFEGIRIESPDWEIEGRIQEKQNEIKNAHTDMKYGDFDIFRFEDTDTYIVVIKTQVSYGIVNNR